MMRVIQMEVDVMLSWAPKTLFLPIGALLLGLSCGPSAQAQTLTQALDAAWARYPQAVVQTARQQEAQAKLDLATGLTPGPSAVSLSNLNDKLSRHQGRQEWEMEVSTPLWLPGQKTAREAEAGHTVSEVAAQGLALRWQLAGDVREAWWAVAAARETSALAHQRLQTDQVLNAVVQRRFKAGDLARLDANVAQTEWLAAQAEQLEADDALRQAQQVFQLLTGTEAPATLTPESAQVTSDVATHPKVLALQALVDLAGSRIVLVDTSRREAPELALRWNSQRGDATEPYANTFGIKVTVPFSSGPRVRQDHAAAQAELAHAEAELALTRTQLQQAIQKAQREWITADRQLALAQERQTLTTDTLSLVQRAFDVGESDLPALMRARAAAHEAQSWFKRQEVARHAALSRLHQAQGVLP